MKSSLCLLCFFTLLSTGCVRKGLESKYVKLESHQLVGDGNNNDSNFFQIRYTNQSPNPIADPYLRMAIKDTSSKLFKKTLYSESKNFPTIPANTYFTVLLYADDFQYYDLVGKTKFFLSWTNSEGKTAIRRSIRY